MRNVVQHTEHFSRLLCYLLTCGDPVEGAKNGRMASYVMALGLDRGHSYPAFLPTKPVTLGLSAGKVE